MEEDQDVVTCINIITRSVLYIFEGLRIVVKRRAGFRRIFIFLGQITYMCYICIYAGTEGATRIYFGKLRPSMSMDDNSNAFPQLRTNMDGERRRWPPLCSAIAWFTGWGSGPGCLCSPGYSNSQTMSLPSLPASLPQQVFKFKCTDTDKRRGEANIFL